MTFSIKTTLTSLAIAIAFVGTSQVTTAEQDTTDLLSMLGDDNETTYTMATFKSTRVINGQSIENVAGGVLDFRISHRFGTFNSGPHKLYGLDIAQMRLGFEYGITDQLMVGVGRSNVNEEVDAFVKYKILRQSSGAKNMPITLSWFSSIVSRNTAWDNKDRKNYFTSRLYYCHQLLIGRKMNERLSLQLSPTVVHRNMVPTKADKNDVVAVGAGGRYKLTQRTSVNAEYFYVLPNQITSNYVNSLSLGIDLETGGHVFQLHVTNSSPMNEKGFITETTGKWSKGDIQFGFNVSRVFTVREKKAPRD
jgi:hypothetical protein